MKLYEDLGGSGISHGRADDLVLTLDVSWSMKSKDYAPSRIRAAARAGIAIARRKAKEAPNDRIALVDFCSTARVALPLTTIRGNLRKIERQISGIRAGGGTDICEGLLNASWLFGLDAPKSGIPSSGLLGWLKRSLFEDCLPPQPPQADPAVRSRRIILLSDGGHIEEGDPVALAADLKQSGIVIDCIGIGDQRWVASSDEKAMKQIASSPTDGRDHYFYIGDSQALIKKCESLAMNIKPLQV